MKRLIFLLTLIIVSFRVVAQTSMSINEINSLTGEQYSTIIKKQFNAVINSSGKTTIGNYASADIKDGNLVFNATKNFKNGNLLSINANGSISDGFFSVFNQTKINSNVGLDLKYNLILKKRSSLSFHTEEINKLRNLYRYADTEYLISKSMHIHDSIVLQKKLALVKTEIEALSVRAKKTSSDAQENASTEYILALKQLELDSLNLKLETLKSREESDIYNSSKRKKAKQAATEAFEYSAIRLKWISIGTGIQNNDFNRFKSGFIARDSQIIKQNYTAWNFTVEGNLYNWNHYSLHTFYLLLGGKFTIDDSFSDLSKVELTDTYQYGDTIAQRTLTKKIIAYKGDYKTKLVGGKFYIDFYKFFLGNSAAIHIFPEVNYKHHYKPLYNAGVGLLYSFKDAKDKENKAKLNAELYFKLSDLRNNANSEFPLFQRNELGLRLSIPVSFFNF
jgi:hypothetical protein